MLNEENERIFDSKRIFDSIDELKEIGKVLEEKEISSFLDHPKIDDTTKLEIIDNALTKYKFNKTLIAFIKVLIVNKRCNYLNNIIEALSEYLDNLCGVVRVDVISNIALNDKIKEVLTSKLEMHFNKKVVLNVLIDKDIIGGIVIKCKNYIIDASLLNKLKAIKDTILYGE